jgi:hypothetical protein
MWSVSKGIVWRHIWTTWAIGNDYRIRGLRCRSADALRALDTSPWWEIESARSSLWRQSILLMSSLVVSKYFLPFALSPWPPEAADSVCIETPIHPKSSSDSSSNTLRGLEPPLFRFPASSHSFANSLYRTAPTFTYHHSLLHHTVIQTALLPTRPYKCRKPHRMPAVPPVAHIPMSNYATRRSYTGLDPVPENALPSGSRSSTPSIGGSTRVSPGSAAITTLRTTRRSPLVVHARHLSMHRRLNLRPTLWRIISLVCPRTLTLQHRRLL